MLVLSALLTSIVASPFVLMAINSRIKKTKIKKQLHNLLVENGLIANQLEYHPNFALAVDQNKKALVYTRLCNEIQHSSIIDLSIYQSCSILKESQHSKNGTAYLEDIDKVALEFKSRNTPANERIVLFDSQESLQLTGELAIAAHWKPIIDLLLDNATVMEIPSIPNRKVLDFSRIAVL